MRNRFVPNMRKGSGSGSVQVLINAVVVYWYAKVVIGLSVLENKGGSVSKSSLGRDCQLNN